MLGPFATAIRRYIASHQVSLVARQIAIAQAACNVHDNNNKTTTTTRDRGDRYGPTE